MCSWRDEKGDDGGEEGERGSKKRGLRKPFLVLWRWLSGEMRGLRGRGGGWQVFVDLDETKG